MYTVDNVNKLFSLFDSSYVFSYDLQRHAPRFGGACVTVVLRCGTEWGVMSRSTSAVILLV